MKRRTLSLFGTIACLICATTSARGAEQLVEQVRRSIEEGIKYLRSQENGNGSWDRGAVGAGHPGGFTGLALLALLNSGVKPEDPAVERGLKHLRTIEPRQTYVVGLQTMAFAEAGRNEDRERIRRNVDWLLQAVGADAFSGWGYEGRGGGTDNSNTQYALLGLHAGHVAGIKIDRNVWQVIQDFYIHSQILELGAWKYGRGRNEPQLTMTTAGLCGLLISGMDLNAGREVLLPDGTAANCGAYKENEPAAKAMAWISRHFRIQNTPYPYYNLYGLERAGRLSGQRFFGEHDWYRAGSEYLVGQQKDDGSWLSNSSFDGGPIVSTSFALLFLSKGRTPVLISKLYHSPVDRPGDDWNNDRNDARHLTEYASQELFKKQPLAWQVFNIRKRDVRSKDDLSELTRELLQSPIAYFNGHTAPRFTATEEELLKQYVEQGGFILAEACCGEAQFDAGFRELMAKLFPDNQLKELPPEHPVWKTHFHVPPGDPYKLFGIDMGCKTVVVYCPQDLSCQWESNLKDNGRGLSAFRLGANIVAYATGMEPPKPRLTPTDVIPIGEDSKRIPRGYLKVGQLRHDGDWQPAPKAMRNLMHHLRSTARLDVALQTEELRTGRSDLLDFKLIYMHGRNPFSIGPDARKLLRANLETGGLLFADACCGKERFDESFRAFVRQLFPDKKLERIPLTDVLFGAELNGKEIQSVRCRRTRGAGAIETEFQEVAPFLEGIKVGNRWAVVYSKYDVGCALESLKVTSSDCIGHDHASALRLGGAIVLYALRP